MPSDVTHREAISGAPPAFGGWFGLARHIAVGGMAGVIAGLAAGGVGGRVFMRIAGAAAADVAQGRTTEAGFRVGEVTLGGSIGLIIFIGVISGAAGAVFYLIFRPWLSWAGRWRGAAFGVVLFAATSATSDMLNPDNPDFRILRNELLLVPLIATMFWGFGLLIDWLFGRLDRALPPALARHDPVRFFYLGLVGFGMLLSAIVPMALYGGETCSCDPPYTASIFVTVAAVATAIWWLSGIINWLPASTTRGVSLLGYLATGGVMIFGLLRVVSDISSIVS